MLRWWYWWCSFRIVGGRGEIILGAGLGSTGTHSLTDALLLLGYSTGHYNFYVNASSSPAIKCPMAKQESRLRARLCKERTRAANRSTRVRTTGMADELWLGLGKLDAVFDTPVPDFFPYVFAAFSEAKVILTTRDPLVLALDRASKHTSASPPLSELFSGDECGDASIVAAERARRLRRRARPSRDSEKKRSEKELRAARREWSRGEVTRRHTFNSVDAYALAVEAHNALVKQLVPPEQLLVLDVTRQSTKASWNALSAFLGKPVPLDACLDDGCRFPETSSRAYPYLPWTRDRNALLEPSPAILEPQAARDALHTFCPLCAADPGCYAQALSTDGLAKWNGRGAYDRR